MNDIPAGLTWHSPVIDLQLPVAYVMVAALVAAAFGGFLARRVSRSSFATGALGGAALTLIAWLALTVLHAKWAILFVVAIALTVSVFARIGTNAAVVPKGALVVLALGYTVLAAAAIALVRLT